MSRSPNLAEVIITAVRAGLADVHTCMPARVVRYDPAKQLADVKPEVAVAHLDEEGNRVAAVLPVIPNCPVVFATGGGRAVIIHPEVGDLGMLFFSEVSLDKWLTRGAEVDPEFDHRHHLSDGVFVPGVAPFSAPRGTAPSGCVALGTPGGSYARIAREGDTISVSLTDLVSALDARYATNPGPPPLGHTVGGTITSGSDDVKAT